MKRRPYHVSRDRDGNWMVIGPDGPVYDKDWRWNSRSTARAVAREYNGSSK